MDAAQKEDLNKIEQCQYFLDTADTHLESIETLMRFNIDFDSNSTNRMANSTLVKMVSSNLRSTPEALGLDNLSGEGLVEAAKDLVTKVMRGIAAAFKTVTDSIARIFRWLYNKIFSSNKIEKSLNELDQYIVDHLATVQSTGLSVGEQISEDIKRELDISKKTVLADENSVVLSERKIKTDLTNDREAIKRLIAISKDRKTSISQLIQAFVIDKASVMDSLEITISRLDTISNANHLAPLNGLQDNLQLLISDAKKGRSNIIDSFVKSKQKISDAFNIKKGKEIIIDDIGGGIGFTGTLRKIGSGNDAVSYYSYANVNRKVRSAKIMSGTAPIGSEHLKTMAGYKAKLLDIVKRLENNVATLSSLQESIGGRNGEFLIKTAVLLKENNDKDSEELLRKIPSVLSEQFKLISTIGQYAAKLAEGIDEYSVLMTETIKSYNISK